MTHLSPIAGDEDFRMSRYAVQIGQSRMQLLNRHAPTGADSHLRYGLDAHINATLEGSLTIDASDFNEEIQNLPGLIAFPSPVLTYRLNSREDRWSTAIDGFRLSPPIAAAANIHPLQAIHGAQHRPIKLDLQLDAAVHDNYRWERVRPLVHRDRVWDPDDINHFNDLLNAEDFDGAWRHWHIAAGGYTNSSLIAASPAWGAWSCGAEDVWVRSLWKKQRQLFALRTADGDRQAHEVLTLINQHISEASEMRLKSWLERIRTRGGAAKWLKGNMQALSENTPLSLHDCAFSLPQKAAQCARSLAQRWRMQIGSYTLPSGNDRFNLSYLTGDVPAIDVQPTQHTPFRGPDLPDLDFSNIPVLPPAPRWRPSDILQHAPKGAAGLDGWFGSFFADLDDTSLRTLCLLLDAADSGHFPIFWTQARNLGIPKPGSADLRPLTIMSALYRLWAKRHAARLSEWLNPWAPSGVVGARKTRAAQDTAWHVQLALEHAKIYGRHSNFNLVSLDAEKYFDTLNIDALKQAVTSAGLPQIYIDVLTLYTRLEKHVFIQGQPLGVVLVPSDDTQGVPQGCPLACSYTVLLGALWHRKITEVAPQVDAKVYLDDRILMGGSRGELELALHATKRFDDAFNSKMNVDKSHRFCIGRQLACGPRLSATPH